MRYRTKTLVEKTEVKPDTDEITLANLIFWKKFKDSIEENLKKTSLKDLIDEARRIKKSKAHSTYPFNI